MGDIEVLTRSIISSIELYEANHQLKSGVGLGTTLLGSPQPTLDELKPITEALKANEKYRAVDGWFVYSNGDSRRITAEWLADLAFPQFSWKRVDEAEKAAKRVHQILTTRETPIRVVTIVWGPHLHAAIEMADTSRMIPVSEFREAGGQEIHPSALSGFRRFFGEHGRGLANVTPVVLAITDKAFPFVAKLRETQLQVQENLNKQVDTCCRVLATFGLRAPILDVSKVEFLDDQLNRLWDEKIAFWRRPEVISADVQSMELNVDCFLKAFRNIAEFPQPLNGWRSRLLSAMKRFELCLSRTSPGDQAVDMCIAYEQVLDSGGGWKNGFRCAAVIGGDLRVRSEVRDVIESLYEVRNRKVHGSESADTELVKTKMLGKVPPEEVVSRGRAIFSDVLLKLLDCPDKPNWFEVETRGQIQ